MKRITLLLFVFALCSNIFAQETKLTKEQIMAMSIEELSELPLEDLMLAVETLGVSSVDELFAMIMNKNVSSASKKEEDTFTSPLSSSVLTREEMRTYGITTIEEAFRLIPGMIVTEKTNGIYDVHMRGLNSIPDNNMLLYTENQNTLLMIDGRIAHNYAMGAVNFDMLPISIEDINRIEVVRGASSAMYGPNAVNGVINIITDKANSASKFVQGSLQMGNMNTAIGDIAFRKQLNDKWSAGISAHLQLRRRPTEKLYIIPQKGVMLAKNETVTPAGTTLSAAELGGLLADGSLADASNGGYYSLDQIENMKQLFSTDGANYTVYDCVEPETPMSKMFPNPGQSRKSDGINGYLTFTPNENIRIDLTGGYQQSFINSTPVGDDYFSFNGRESKTAYGNLNANIYGLSLNANVSAGPQNYAYGCDGFKVHTCVSNFSAEYDFKLGDLSIRPGVSYQYIKYSDYEMDYYDANNNGQMDPGEERYGYFGTVSGSSTTNKAYMKDFGPSLRLDYRLGDLRLIAAIRSDKTNIPDNWNTSWQAAANYSINDNNFVRVVYGRSRRSANMVQSNTNFTWNRTNLITPNEITFLRNTEPDLVYIDNIELGYRWRPANNILVDAEMFYAMSSDYGALMADESAISVKNYYLTELLSQAVNVDLSNPAVTGALIQQFSNNLKTKSYIRYGQLPYDVKQLGLSMNVDWIITPRLIAKFNVNVQKTTIDNYYPYSQQENIQKQLMASQETLTKNITPMMAELIYGISTQGQAYIDAAMGYSPVNQYKEKIGWDAMDDDKRKAQIQALKDDYQNGTNTTGVERPLGMYYSLQYDVLYDRDLQAYYFGSSKQEDVKTVNGHEHKATPSVYGMIGLIYKPIDKVNVAAFGNYLAKREYTTKYGTVELDDRFTVNLKLGYQPVEGFEVFFNAHNLFNSRAREFNFGDEIGGLYTVGVNFGF